MTEISSRKDPDTASDIPRPLRVSAALSWRLLVICGALYVLGVVASQLHIVLIPVAIALLLSALIAPAVNRLTTWGVPRALSTVVVLIGGIAVVGGVLTAVINAFIAGFPELRTQLVASLNRIRDWLVHGPLGLRQEQLDSALTEVVQWLQHNQAALTSGALSTASALTDVITGLALALFTLIFFLYDGRQIWRFLLLLAPRTVRNRVDVAGSRGFESLVGYVRATALVAVADAIGIGIGLVIIGVPLAVPLAALVFLGGFVPIVGALVSGSVAVLVGLVTGGPIVALLVLGVVLLVQQVEGHVLQPLLLGKAVRLHALAIVLAIAAGVVQAGIAGALLAVPIVAVLNSAIRSLCSDDAEGDGEPRQNANDQPSDDVDRAAEQSQSPESGNTTTSEEAQSPTDDPDPNQR